jgi:spore maturation protein CgeB
MIGDDNGRAAIARAGQARTMAQHSYRHRASEILGFVEGVRASR